MADVLVSARVAQAKKDAAKGILASLDSTTSDLINSAFDYVLEKKELPQADTPRRPTMAEFEHYVEESTLPINWGADAPDGDYRKLLHQGKRDAYESLA